MKRKKSIPEKVRDLLEAGPLTSSQICDMLGGVNRANVSSALLHWKRKGLVDVPAKRGGTWNWRTAPGPKTNGHNDTKRARLLSVRSDLQAERDELAERIQHVDLALAEIQELL